MAKGIFQSEILIIIVLAFILATTITLSHKILTELRPYLNQTTTGANVTQNTFNAISSLDFGAVLIVFGFGIGMVIMSFMVRSHPIFFIPGIILLIIAVLISPQISNAFEYYATSEEISSSVVNFVLIQTMMSNLPLIVTIIGLIFMIVMYSKSINNKIGE